MVAIIVCGPNGSGKSTLAATLGEILSKPVVHAGPAAPNKHAAMRCCFNQYSDIQLGKILDRCTPISRLVYQNGLIYSEKMYLRTAAQLFANEAKLIYCTHIGPMTRKEYYTDSHWKEINDYRDEIIHRYHEVMSGLPHIRYDYAATPIETILNWIES